MGRTSDDRLTERRKTQIGSRYLRDPCPGCGEHTLVVVPSASEGEAARTVCDTCERVGAIPLVPLPDVIRPS